MFSILMRPDDSLTSLIDLKHLVTTGECLFDLSLDGPRLRLFLFEIRSNMLHEKNYYSFVDEVTFRRWTITACQKIHLGY